MKKFPADTETVATDGHIKIESSQKHIKYKGTGKYSSDNDTGLSSKIKGGVTQKGREGKILVTQEKQSSNPISTFKGGAIQKSNATENETIIEKTPLIEKTGGSSSTQTTGSTDVFIKIGDIKGEKDDK